MKKRLIYCFVSVTLFICIGIHFRSYFYIQGLSNLYKNNTVLPVLALILPVTIIFLTAVVVFMIIMRRQLIKRLSVENNLNITKIKLENIVILEKMNESNDERIYKTYHDLNNHFSFAVSMLSEADMNNFKNYIKQLKTDLEREVDLNDINN